MYFLCFDQGISLFNEVIFCSFETLFQGVVSHLHSDYRKHFLIIGVIHLNILNNIISFLTYILTIMESIFIDSSNLNTLASLNPKPFLSEICVLQQTEGVFCI